MGGNGRRNSAGGRRNCQHHLYFETKCWDALSSLRWENSAMCEIKHKPVVSFKRRGDSGGLRRGRGKKSGGLRGTESEDLIMIAGEQLLFRWN